MIRPLRLVKKGITTNLYKKKNLVDKENPRPSKITKTTSQSVSSNLVADYFEFEHVKDCSTCGNVCYNCMCNFTSHLEELRKLDDIVGDPDIVVFEPQSGTTNDARIHQISKSSDYENVQFSDQHDPYIYDVESSVDPTRRLQDSSDATLDHFFSRPIKIHEEEWGTGTTLGFDINPWSLYWDNPRVSNRISNYNLLRCNLRVKVVINGNGFQYGRAICAYLPLNDFDSLSTNATLIPSDLVGTSQLPHIFLDPTTSTGGEMKLPMFNYQNYIGITNSQWSSLGTLYVRSLNNLKHANGATDVVTVSIFAWAEDVSMSVLTSLEPDTLDPQMGYEVFEPQSGEIDEANKEGIVSGPATTISKWASFLTKVPYIGPFATATMIASDATSKIAKMFGYCRPPVTKNPDPYRPTPISSLALTNVPDTAQKMTVDDKQELSIDPRIAGIGGVDPLNIREIAKRESFLTKFNWNIGSAPETLLWNARVDPVTWAEDSSTPVSFHFPACAFAALPFEFWTGSMKFRFQIVASSFHKGRLKFVYDPNYLRTNEYNTNYLKIIDIAEEQDFTIEVGLGRERTLLRHHKPGIDSVTTMYSDIPYTSLGVGNGVIGVYIVNELTTPNSTVNNDIEVNVFVSMGDDFEVFVPDDHFQKFTFAPYVPPASQMEPQSGIVSESQNTAEPSAPQQEMSSRVGMGGTQDPNINKVYTGEAITSFRTMLKRYNLWNAIGALSVTDIVTYGRFPAFPYLRGAVSEAVNTTGAGGDYNYCNTVMLHWVRNAFQGWRGSIRYKFITRGTTQISDHVEVQRSPYNITAPLYDYGQVSLPSYATNTEVSQSIIQQSTNNGVPRIGPFSGVLGKVLTTASTNPNLEFEVPYYSDFRFTPGKPSSYTGIQLLNPAAYDYRVEWNGDVTSVYDIYSAAGEDFQVYFFTGLPRMYYEPIAPA